MSLTTKIALVATLVLASASVAFAQSAVPEYDGDGNAIPGRYNALPRAPSAIERSFAAQPPVVTVPPRSYGANGPEWQLYFDNWLSRGGQGSGATMFGSRGR
jgi:hypothetical protein